LKLKTNICLREKMKTMTKDLPQVTERDTKATILDAHKKALAKIEQLESGKMNPTAILEAKETAAVIKAVEEVATESTIEEQIAWLKKNMGNVLDSLTNGIAEQLDTYNKVKKAIKVQEDKLGELFDIEAEALNLVALVNSKQELEAEYDAKFTARKLAAEAELAEIIKAGQEQRSLIQKQISEQRTELEKERKREQENYDYEFNRKKREREDSLADELNEKRKAFDAGVQEVRNALDVEGKELNAREDAIEKREAHVNELEATIEELKANTDKAVSQAKHATESKLKAEFEREKEYLAKDAKHAEEVLQNQVDMLHSNLVTANEKNKELEAKLEKAYAEIRELANKTVDNAGDKKVVSQLERMLVTQQTKQ